MEVPSAHQLYSVTRSAVQCDPHGGRVDVPVEEEQHVHLGRGVVWRRGCLQGGEGGINQMNTDRETKSENPQLQPEGFE